MLPVDRARVGGWYDTGIRPMAGKPKVLMLDDEGFLLTLYKAKFEGSGFEVAAYFGPHEALQALRAGYQPDVVLFDITMPEEISGYQFLEIVQVERLCPKALKIALTNEGQDGEMARTKELGADAHLMKAKFTPAELVAKVSEMLSKR